MRHGQAHLTRSILEGVAFGIKDMFCLMRDAGLGTIEEVRVSGGGAKSLLWRQVLADTLDAELVTVNTTEGAAFGAALLAGVGAGVWSNVDEACAATVSISDRVSPNKETTKLYDSIYDQYKRLYPILKPIFHAVGSR
jgi:xylulokinase